MNSLSIKFPVSMSSKRKQWDDYKARQGKRLSANVQGKCQKYNRIRPLTLVPFDKEPTFKNIKDACKSHFGTKSECDVLASERGPRTRMKVRSKTGRRSFTSDFWSMRSRKKLSNQSSSDHYIKVSQLAHESAIVRLQLLQNRNTASSLLVKC